MIMDYLPTLFLALGVAKLITMLGLQISGDMREAARQASIKKIGAQKRPYTPTVSVLIDADDLLAPISEYLDSICASTYMPTEIIVIAPAGSPEYFQARNYRKLHNLSKVITIRKRSDAFHWLATTKQKKTKGKIVVLLDGSSMLLPTTIAQGIVPFRDRTVAAVLPFALPRITTSIDSGLRAARHIVSMHFRRGRNPKASTIYGALFIREVTLRRIARKHQSETELTTLNGMVTIAQGMGKSSRVVRHSDAAVLAERVRFAPLPSYGAFLWWATDVLAIGAVLYTFGRYEGTIVLGFAAVFGLFLAAIAILSAKGVRAADKLNLFLLTPFVYIIAQLLAPFWWIFRKA